jgi:hypothetical protein
MEEGSTEVETGDEEAGDAPAVDVVAVGAAEADDRAREADDRAREAMVRATLARVGRAELAAALPQATDARYHPTKAVVNAVSALRRQKDPAAALGRPLYRPALPYVAAALADPCLAAVVEHLGERADDPTREELLEALDALRADHPDEVIAVMLASVADGEMPSSDLCFDLVCTDDRFTPPDWRSFERPDEDVVPTGTSAAPTPAGPSDEQRAARKARRQARRADRPTGRATTPAAAPRAAAPTADRLAPGGRIRRRAALTPAQELSFDRDDPWVGGVVVAWVPFGGANRPDGDDELEAGGKTRPCVVVAGSPTRLLVRAGYSEGGVVTQSWKTVELSHWRRAGLDKPTFVDADILDLPREGVEPPIGTLTSDDWNALW